MAGRGRGRGFGGGGFRRPVQGKPFQLFPEIEDLGKAIYSADEKTKQLIRWSASLQKYWNNSPYYQSESTERVQKPDIERYSDKNSQAAKAKPPLWHFISLDPNHFPPELITGGMKKDPRSTKRVRWNPDSDLQRLDVFEKLEQKYQGQGSEKKEKEEEEEDNAGIEEDEGEDSDNGDYEQNEDFDDDEDDYNMPDDDYDEPSYD